MTVTLVCGPPCAGKTTYVLNRALAGDLVVDHDLIAQSLGSTVTHGHGQRFRKLAEREVRLRMLEIQTGMHERAWVIRTMARPQRQAAFATRLGDIDLVVLDPGIEVCRQRAMSRPNPTFTLTLIDRWYAVRANAGDAA